MIINSIEIKGLYGYMDKTIMFHPDISLLVGINGSGKTSVLNIINWLLMPSFGDLCVTQFESIRMIFSHKEKDYTIECEHLKQKFEYKLYSIDKMYHPLTFTVLIPPDKIKNNDSVKAEQAFRYNRMTPDENEAETMFFLNNELPRPINVGLDRGAGNVKSDDESNDFLINKGTKRVKSISNSTPLNYIKNIVNTQYRKKKNSILKLNNNLRNQLVLSAFDGSITVDTISQTVEKPISLDQIESVEKGVYKYFSDIDSSLSHKNENTLIKKYFSQLKNVIKNYENDNNRDQVGNVNRILLSLNVHQFYKLTKILNEFKTLEDQSVKIMKEINLFLDTTNSFFKDSAKHILFKEDTSEICYNSVSKDNKKVLVRYQDINNLSSGEKQLLILFSFLAFNGSKDRIFIIDEPELSLHVKWQEDFLQAIENVTPEGTQIILATHSPILVNKNKKKAIVLLPYNS